MRIVETRLAGCFVIEPTRLEDERGFFARTFDASIFAEHGLNRHLAQASISFNRTRGTLRGLHFQGHPAMEEKLVRVETGAIFDVAVDLRPGAPTFGRWVGEELTAENGRQLYIPQGFAHGFLTLAPDTTVSYQISVDYRPDLTSGLAWDDPDVGVAWPAAPQVQSPRDLALPRLSEINQALLVSDARA